MAKLNCVTVLAPAKLNLALDVVGLLPNGYHNLDMTMQAITLYERVVLRRSPYLNLRLPGSLVAPNNKNTAIKAALAFFHYTGLLAGVDITIYKNTPVRAGMAGGSADAAAVLVGLNALYGAKLSMSELCALGAGIGADVPFALMGGTCRVQGVGDVIKALPPVPDCWFTVVMPDYGVSTPEAFAAYDISVDFEPSGTNCAIGIQVFQERSGVVHFRPLQKRSARSDTLDKRLHGSGSPQHISRMHFHIWLTLKYFRIIVHHALPQGY